MAIKLSINKSDIKRILSVIKNAPYKIGKIMENDVGPLAATTKAIMLDAIKTTEPLSELTIEKKGHDLPFLETGRYLKALNIYKTKLPGLGFHIIIGIPRGTETPRGLDLVELGGMLEQGYITPVTNKMREYFKVRHNITIHENVKLFVTPPRPHISLGIRWVRRMAPGFVEESVKKYALRVKNRVD